MAADLAADLDEAEAEGASAEAVLGGGADDPRSFAASWAAERAVIPPRRVRLPARMVMIAAIAALAVTVAGAVLVVFESTSAPEAATEPLVLEVPGAPGSPILVRVPPPVGVVPPEGTSWIESVDSGVAMVPASGSDVEVNLVGAILLGVGLVGVIASMLVLFRSSRPGPTAGLT